MWPILDITIEECMKRLRAMELDTYMRILSVIRAKGSLCDERRRILRELAILLNISKDRHLAEARRASNNELLATIAYRLTGRDWCEEWEKEGRSSAPPVFRLPPLTVNTPLADKVALLATASHRSHRRVVKKALAETVRKVAGASLIAASSRSERSSTETGSSSEATVKDDDEEEEEEEEEEPLRAEASTRLQHVDKGFVPLPSGLGVFVSNSDEGPPELRTAVKRKFEELEREAYAQTEADNLPSASCSSSRSNRFVDIEEVIVDRIPSPTEEIEISELTNGVSNSQYDVDSDYSEDDIETSIVYNDHLVSEASGRDLSPPSGSPPPDDDDSFQELCNGVGSRDGDSEEDSASNFPTQLFIPDILNGTVEKGSSNSTPSPTPTQEDRISPDIGKRPSSALSDSSDGYESPKRRKWSDAKLLKLNVKGMQKLCGRVVGANLEPLKMEELMSKILPTGCAAGLASASKIPDGMFDPDSPSDYEDGAEVDLNGDTSMEESVAGSSDSYLSSKSLPPTVQLHRKVIFSSDQLDAKTDAK